MAGSTIARASLQPAHLCERIIQKARSHTPRRRPPRVRMSTATCCRSARFSRANSCRVRNSDLIVPKTLQSRVHTPPTVPAEHAAAQGASAGALRQAQPIAPEHMRGGLVIDSSSGLRGPVENQQLAQGRSSEALALGQFWTMKTTAPLMGARPHIRQDGVGAAVGLPAARPSAVLRANRALPARTARQRPARGSRSLHLVTTATSHRNAPALPSAG